MRIDARQGKSFMPAFVPGMAWRGRLPHPSVRERGVRVERMPGTGEKTVMSGYIVEASPQVVEPMKSAVKQFVGYVTSNSNMKTLLIVIGALIIVVCAVLLFLRKYAPQTAIGQSLGGQEQGSKKVIWVVAAMLLALCLILPDQILPFVTGILAEGLQMILDILSKIFSR